MEELSTILTEERMSSFLPFLNFQNAKEVGILILGGFISITLNQWLEKKPKLIAYIGQQGIFRLKKRENLPETEILTHSIVIKNDGKKSAKNINVIHVNLPEDFTVFPATDWTLKELNYGAKALVFPNLAPSQQITIAYLYPPNFPLIHGEISYEEGMAKIIEMLPVQQISQSLHILRCILILTGLIFWLYLIFFLLTHFQIL